jgi:hypothetical protein
MGSDSNRQRGFSTTESARRRFRVDHTHDRHQRRIAAAVGERLSQVLSFDETVLACTDGIVHGDLMTRAILGAYWAPSRRVALAFTAHRMIEFGLSVTGRRAVGRIRSFPWDRVPGLELKDRWLELRTWADATFRWYLRDELDPSIQQLLRAQADLAVSTYQPSQIRSVPLLHCSSCGVVRTNPEGGCPRCNEEVRSPRLAKWLAVALPGAGSLYASRRRAAGVRFASELLIYGATVWSLLVADSLRSAVPVAAVGLLVLLLMKFHGGAEAQILAKQAEAVTPSAHRRWRWIVPIGLLLSLVVAIVPLRYIGMADGDVSWDLDVLQSRPTWTGFRAGGDTLIGPEDRDLRSRWFHPDGWELQIHAAPLKPFETIEAARARIANEIDGDGQLTRIGPHDALWGRETSAAAGRETTEVRLAVIDTVGRDVHILSMRVDPDQAAVAGGRLEKLLRRAIWIPASQPLGRR